MQVFILAPTVLSYSHCGAYSCYDLTDNDTGSNSGYAEFNFLTYHRSSVLIGQSLMSDSRCDA